MSDVHLAEVVLFGFTTVDDSIAKRLVLSYCRLFISVITTPSNSKFHSHVNSP